MPYLGKSPATVPVTAADIPDNSITAAKLVDGSITIDDIGANAVGNSEMANDAVGIPELSASGTASNTTFLRGDNAWAVVDTNLVADTSPQLGGNLDLNSNNITGTGGIPAGNLTGNIAAARLTVATTQAESDNSTKLATTAYVTSKITTLIGGAPSTLNDLNELALAINDDSNYNSTLTTALATKLPLAGGAMTGAITTNSTFDGVDIATRDGVLTSTTATAAAALPKAGGAMTGTITNFRSTGIDDNANALAMTIDSSENVGIGTASPTGDGATIHINGSTTYSTLHLTNSTTGGGAGDGTYIVTSGNDLLLRNREAGIVALYSNNAERMRIDSSGNVGIGTVPKGWVAYEMLQIGDRASFGSANGDEGAYMSQNAYNDGAWKRIETSAANQYTQNGSGHFFNVAASGSADAAISWNTAMTIATNGEITTLGGIASSVAGGYYMIQAAQGNNTYPTYSFQNDGNTGMLRPAADTLGFVTGGSERIRIDSSGNVGIGVTPTSNGTLMKQIELGAGSILAAYHATYPNTYLGNNVLFNSSGNMVYKLTDQAAMYYQDSAGIHRFQVAASGNGGSAINFTTAMMIDNNGEIRAGNLQDSLNGARGISCSGNGYASLRVRRGADNGACMAFYGSSSTSSSVGSISVTTSSTAYNTSSDYRLKENVVDMENATDRVKQLKPKRFNFIADDSVTVDGFLAHEAATVVPECVSGTKDAMRDEEYEVTPAVMDGEIEVTPAVMGTRSVPDYQGIDQSKLVPLLVKTIQELEARITALEA